jgi:hypothetical protein
VSAIALESCPSSAGTRNERSRPPYHQPSPIPAAYAWPALLAKDGDALFDHYRHTLEELGKQPGTLALIFGKAQNKFDSRRLKAALTLRAPCGRPISSGGCQDPAKLRRVIVDLIDAESWSAMGVDVKGDAYECLLEKNAQDTKSGAGQYFTPRDCQALARRAGRRGSLLAVRWLGAAAGEGGHHRGVSVDLPQPLSARRPQPGRAGRIRHRTVDGRHGVARSPGGLLRPAAGTGRACLRSSGRLDPWGPLSWSDHWSLSTVRRSSTLHGQPSTVDGVFACVYAIGLFITLLSTKLTLSTLRGQ